MNWLFQAYQPIEDPVEDHWDSDEIVNCQYGQYANNTVPKQSNNEVLSLASQIEAISNEIAILQVKNKNEQTWFLWFFPLEFIFYLLRVSKES